MLVVCGRLAIPRYRPYGPSVSGRLKSLFRTNVNYPRPRSRIPRPSSGWRRGVVSAAMAIAGMFGWSAGMRAEPVGNIVPDFAAITRNALVSLPPPPSWELNRISSFWTVEDVRVEFARLTDTPPRVTSVRSNLLRADHAWAVAFKKWFLAAQKPLKMHYQHQLWDCDNYANGFVAFANLLALKAGEMRGSFCVGWATVSYQRAFAGIRAGGAHAVVIVGTSQGLFVLEPQDGTMVALKNFPNRDTIEEVFF